LSFPLAQFCSFAIASLGWDFFPQESLDDASLLKLFGCPSQQHETDIAN
jgi:hypothetical protein